KRLRRRF
ncbi:hypothetical protein BVZ85_00892B, partial [Haemophilus influenzae]